MDCLRRLWSDAVAAVPFDVPSTGIGFGAVGSLARGQIGPSSDLDLVIMKVGNDDEGEYMDVVEDDEEFYQVSKQFEERLNDLYDIQ